MVGVSVGVGVIEATHSIQDGYDVKPTADTVSTDGGAPIPLYV
jgi:hypothetical protein